MSDRDDDWVETVTRFAASLGLNPVRVRWRLRRLQSRWQSDEDSDNPRKEQPRFAHRICSQCRSLQDKDAKVCTSCGARLGPRSMEGARRLTAGRAPSISVVLGTLMVLAYFRLILAWPDADFGYVFGMDGRVLNVHGALNPILVEHGQWWRLVTAQFLHIGLLHLGFNLYALSIVGPHVEAMYGRGPALFIFLLTGIVANVVSGMFNVHGNAGASGALMGLIGMAAARGHLAGGHGHLVRNIMLQWFAFTMIFGFAIGADNWAHAGGFVAGGVVGFLTRPRWFRAGQGGTLSLVMGGMGALVTLLAMAIILYPPVALLLV